MDMRDLLRLAILTSTSGLIMCTAVSAQPSQAVLAVYWSSEDFPSSLVMDSTMREIFHARSDVAVDFYAEYLESDRFPGEEPTLAFRDYLKRKYHGRRIDVVIAIAEEALNFVFQHHGELFPHAAVVFSTAQSAPRIPGGLGAGVTGVVAGIRDYETLEMSLALHPNTEHVFVVAYAPSDLYLPQVRKQLAPMASRVELTYLTGPVPDVIAAVKAAPARSLVLYLRHSQEDPGNVMYPQEIARLVADASPVPVYGINDSYMGNGVVGGVMRSARTTGTRLADITVRVLTGTSADAIAIEHLPIVPTFDWRQVRRWGIDPSRLPAGSDVRYRDPTVWELYGAYIAGTLLLVALQGALIGALVAQRARRRHAEAVIRRNEAALRKSYEQIRRLAGHLITAQELARTRIARDLHDDVCQELAAMGIEIAELQRTGLAAVGDSHIRFLLSSLQRRAHVLVESIRRLSHDLHPSTLSHMGLAASLEAHCIEVEQRYDTQVSLNVRGSLRNLPEDTVICLFRIAQEALRNAATHGSARRIAVTVTRSESCLALVVQDDGSGFEVAEARIRGGGLGLVSMHERARLVGGQVFVDSRPSHGTVVRVSVPIDVNEAAVQQAQELSG